MRLAGGGRPAPTRLLYAPSLPSPAHSASTRSTHEPTSEPPYVSRLRSTLPRVILWIGKDQVQTSSRTLRTTGTTLCMPAARVCVAARSLAVCASASCLLAAPPGRPPRPFLPPSFAFAVRVDQNRHACERLRARGGLGLQRRADHELGPSGGPRRSRRHLADAACCWRAPQ